VILIGAGFGPLPSITAVAMQNVVPRHQLGISVGTMNFSRNLLATILIAVFGAIVLAGTGQSLSGALAAGTGQAQAFARVFFAAAASMSIALIALALLEEKPLQADAEVDAH
jgi:sugar phosphate permease